MKAQASTRRDDARGKKDQGGKDKAQSQAVASRNDDKARKPEPRGKADRGNRDVRVETRVDAGRDRVRVLADGRHRYETRGQRVHFDFDAAPRGLVDGCPPGLAKKHNGCMPPGLARNDVRYRFVRYRPDWWGFPRLADGRYFYDDGYLMRLSGDRVVSYLPLFGGALSVGNRWPSFYAPLPVPDYYVNYYDLGPPGSYRYADNVLYRVDPTTAAITSVAALLTGNDIQIGSPMPLGYDVYNVPYPYRSMYYDSPDAYYRYSDGYIYQLDPTTRLVTAAIDLLAT